MPKKYSEQFKMQVAYDYFVDRCSVNALCDKYKLTVHTVRYFYKNRRGEYRDAIFRNWKDEEKRLRRAVSDYLSGGSAEEVAQEYNICMQWLLKLVDMRFVFDRATKIHSRGTCEAKSFCLCERHDTGNLKTGCAALSAVWHSRRNNRKMVAAA